MFYDNPIEKIWLIKQDYLFNTIWEYLYRIFIWKLLEEIVQRLHGLKLYSVHWESCLLRVRKELIRGITMTIIALAPRSCKKTEGIRASQISGAF